ncbi:hypothetical protein [Roseibium sp. SCP14]|uniref:hypothetical protein n=1 Tax=Roseibium sp. SCP14 TaxID=3141375 RepID=UPI00333AE59A
MFKFNEVNFSLPGTFVAVIFTSMLTATSLAQEQTKPVELEKTRDMRFCEVLLIKDGMVDIYNSSGLGDCPEDLWQSLDPEKMAAELGVEEIQKNGPHYWVMDSQTVGFGETETFNDIPARWVAQIEAKFLGGSKGTVPYTQFKTCKTQKMVYDNGKKVWEFVDTDGNVWILQAHEAQFTLSDLDNLGAQMKSLPEGWSWRTRVLEEPIVLDLKQSECNMAIGDEFHQYYTLLPSNG